jgi:hypothetical protein
MKMTKCERVENSVCVSEAWSEFSEVRHTFTFHVNKRPPARLCVRFAETSLAECEMPTDRQTAPQRFAFAAASRPGGTG